MSTKGKCFTVEQKARMAEAQRKRWRERPLTQEQKEKWSVSQKKRWKDHPVTEETSARITASHLGLKDSDETRAKKSNAGKDKPKSQEHKNSLAKVALRSWQGGQAGDDFASVLIPAGFIREHHVYYGEYTVKTGYGLRRANFQLDFAHVEAKVDIELDGPGHKTTREQDEIRDSILRDLGWRVIRIRHA